jgi:hypothetical protein
MFITRISHKVKFTRFDYEFPEFTCESRGRVVKVKLALQENTV